MKRWWLILALLLPLQAVAAIDTYEFRDEASRERFRQLTDELRCPKCQNQNLADSNSPIAKDLRGEIYRMLDEQQSDAEIVDFMVARYGEFVLYKPRKTAATWVLWYGPFVLLGLGVVVILLLTRRRKTATAVDKAQPESSADTTGGLNESEQQRLDALLKQDKDR